MRLLCYRNESCVVRVTVGVYRNEFPGRSSKIFPIFLVSVEKRQQKSCIFKVTLHTHQEKRFFLGA